MRLLRAIFPDPSGLAGMGAFLALFAIPFLFYFVWVQNLDYRKLIKTDEGRYAEIAREMVVSGDWVTPRSNGLKYFDKPPLQYWATALAFKAFGLREGSARWWTAFTGLLGVAVTFFAARRIWDLATGYLAAAMLAGTLEWAAMGHFASLDMSLSGFLSAAIAALCVAQRDGATAVTRRRWMLAAWAFTALAVLSKGIVALVLPAGALALYMAWQRDWGLLRRLHLVSGLLLFAVLVAPWFVAVSQANPDFLRFFFIHEHFERYLTSAHGRNAPLWYFIPVLAAGLLPWTFALPQALREAALQRAGRFNVERFLLVWSVFTFVFFSLSHSKLESYILPMYPALVMLIARTLRRATPRLFKWTVLPVAIVGLLIAILAPLLLIAGRATGNVPQELRLQYVPWLIAAGAFLALSAVGALRLARWGASDVSVGLESGNLWGLVALGFGGLVAAQLALAGHESLSPVYSSYHIALRVKPYLAADTPFFAVDTYDHTVPFYTQRTMTMVAYRDEFSEGIALEPQKFIPDLQTFEAVWRAAPRAVAFMAPSQYERFQQERLPMMLIARDSRRVFVSKP